MLGSGEVFFFNSREACKISFLMFIILKFKPSLFAYFLFRFLLSLLSFVFYAVVECIEFVWHVLFCISYYA